MSTAEILQDMLQPYVEPEAAPAPILPLSDFGDWQALAGVEIDSVFEQGLAAGTMGVLAGEGGGGKSFLALQLGLSVAIGRRLIKGFSPTERGRVLCLFGEDDDHIVARRLAACCGALPLSPADIDDAIGAARLELVCGVAAPLLDRETGARSRAYRELENRCVDNQYRLIIVDPLLSFAGIENENDNAGMQLVALALVDLAKASGGALLLLHHANKSGIRNGDTSQGLARGASSLLCAARWVAVLRVLAETDAKRHDIPLDEIERYIEVRVAKNSYAPSAGQRYHLRREEGGALVPVDLAENGLKRLATALADELGTGGGFTRYEVAKGQAAAHKALRNRLSDRTGVDTGRAGMNEAITYGLRHGLLVEAEVKSSRPGVKRVELLAKM